MRVTWAVLVPQPACLLLPPRLRPDCSSPAPTTSIQPRSCQPCSLEPNARLPPPMCQSKPERSSSTSTTFERNRSSPASTLSSQARTLISHLHHVHSSPGARLPPPSPQIEPECSLPPPPCPFEPARSPSTSTVSTRAQTLVSHLHRLK